MNRLFWYGAGGHGISVWATVRDKIRFSLELFDNGFDNHEKIKGFEAVVQGGFDLMKERLEKSDRFFVAIGDNRLRAEMFSELLDLGGVPVNFVHETAYVDSESVLGNGISIHAKSYIGPRAVIQDGAIINTGSIVEHDSIISRFAHVAPNATVCGGCSVGDFCLVGAGSSLIPGVSLGSSIIVGSGATVISSVSEGPAVIGGCPAKRIRSL